MYKRTRIVLILVFLPLLLGIVASFLAQRVWEPVPLLQFKIDVGMVAFVAGGFLTLLTGIAFLAGWTRERNAQRQIEGRYTTPSWDANASYAGSTTRSRTR